MTNAMDTSRMDCSDWYVLHILNGSEKKVIDTIKNISKVKFALYLPQREVIHVKRGVDCKLTKPLFPGYIFVHKEIEQLTRCLACHKLDTTARPLVAGDTYLKMYAHEMKFIFDMTDKNGIIPLSRGALTPGGEVEIVNGPLKDFSGEVLFINKRKKKAKIRINIMNQNMDVTLGFEILQSKEK